MHQKVKGQSSIRPLRLQKTITKCRRFIIMDLHSARVIYDNRGYEPGTSYTRDPYQQAREAYHEAESVLRDAGEL